MNDVKQEYINQYKLFHSKNGYPGNATRHFVPSIAKLLDKTNSTTLLDYGSGQGHFYNENNMNKIWPNVKISCYDPAVPKYSKLPEEQFDCVISTDVLEHIPEQAINDVINTIFSKAIKCIFLSVALYEASETLPNGQNAHCTLKPIDWWQEKFTEHNVQQLPCSISYRHDRKSRQITNKFFFMDN